MELNSLFLNEMELSSNDSFPLTSLSNIWKINDSLSLEEAFPSPNKYPDKPVQPPVRTGDAHLGRAAPIARRW